MNESESKASVAQPREFDATPPSRATISSLKATHTAHRMATEILNPHVPRETAKPPPPKYITPYVDPISDDEKPMPWFVKDEVTNYVLRSRESTLPTVVEEQPELPPLLVAALAAIAVAVVLIAGGWGLALLFAR